MKKLQMGSKNILGSDLLLSDPPKVFLEQPFNDEKNFEIVYQPRSTHERIVPRTIHQTWKTEDVPDIWAQSPRDWIEKHPEYLYVLWRDEDLKNLISMAYPWAVETYTNFKYNIQRADFGRMFVLHAYGGVYSDLDLVPKRSITPLIEMFENDCTEFEIALVQGPSGRCGLDLSNFFMFSLQHAPWILSYFCYVINESWNELQPWYIRVLSNIKHYYVTPSTGPAAVSAVHNKITEDHGKNSQVMIIPAVFVNTTKIYEKVDAHAPQDYNLRFSQLQGRSWCDKSTGFAIGAARAWQNRDRIIFPAFFISLILFIVFLVLYCKIKARI